AHARGRDLTGGRSRAVIVAAVDEGRQRCEAPVRGGRPVTNAGAALGDTAPVAGPVSDDRPFPYLRPPSFPVPPPPPHPRPVPARAARHPGGQRRGLGGSGHPAPPAPTLCGPRA